MAEHMDRREFLKVSGGASAGAFLTSFKTDATLFEKTVRAARPDRQDNLALQARPLSAF